MTDDCLHLPPISSLLLAVYYSLFHHSNLEQLLQFNSIQSNHHHRGEIMIFLGGTRLLCNQMRMHISHQGIRRTSHFVFQHHQKRCFLSLKNHVCTTSSFHRAARRNNFMSGIQCSELQFQRSIRSISSSHKVNNDDDDDDESMRLKVAFLGPPNAGKSTLFNRLMCKESNKSYKLASERISRKPKRSRVSCWVYILRLTCYVYAIFTGYIHVLRFIMISSIFIVNNTWQ